MKGRWCIEKYDLQSLGRREASKLEDNFGVAVRLDCLDKRLAPSDSVTFCGCVAKPHCDIVIPFPPTSNSASRDWGSHPCYLEIS